MPTTTTPRTFDAGQLPDRPPVAPPSAEPQPVSPGDAGARPAPWSPGRVLPDSSGSHGRRRFLLPALTVVVSLAAGAAGAAGAMASAPGQPQTTTAFLEPLLADDDVWDESQADVTTSTSGSRSPLT